MLPTEQIAVIDLETTGLHPGSSDRVVEVGIVVISPDGTVHNKYETLINPKRDIGPSQIHQISAGDVLAAPTFADIAGDVLQILSEASVVAGHNVRFDKRFLDSEYSRIDVALPEIPLLCTTRYFGSSKLKACCDELGIAFEGMPHHAISDALVTAKIIAHMCTDDPMLLGEYRSDNILWPTLPPEATPCFHRQHARQVQEEPPKFLERILSNIHHDVEAESPNVLAYMALIDRILEDRVIDDREESALVEAAFHWKLSEEQLDAAHTNYIHNLAVAALSDGIISDAERGDLHLVANLLGQSATSLDSTLDSAAAQLEASHRGSSPGKVDDTLVGKRVCFTGTLQSRIGGGLITKDIAKVLATDAGMNVASGVTKKLDLLVVADPNTQSGKAKKAREYGIRILPEVTFWRMIGVDVE